MKSIRIRAGLSAIASLLWLLSSQSSAGCPTDESGFRLPGRHPEMTGRILRQYGSDPEPKDEVVEDLLSRRSRRPDLDDALDAFGEVCEQNWAVPAGDENASDDVQARVALAWYKDHVAGTQSRLQNLRAQVDSAKSQLEVAVSIENL